MLVFDQIMAKSDLHEQSYSHLTTIKFPDGDICNYLNCYYPHGRCLNDSTCQCREGYVNAPYLTHSGRFELCKYKQKDFIVSLLLELIFPVGIGHMYCHRNMIAIVKIIFAVVLYYCVKYLLKDEFSTRRVQTQQKMEIGKLLCYFYLGCYIIFHLYDMFKIASNQYLDGNGIPVFKMY